MGSSPWGHKELDTTEQLHSHFLYTQSYCSLSLREKTYLCYSATLG